MLGFIWSGGSDQYFSLEDPVLGNLEFDSIESEIHDWSREVTLNPVENGIPVSDHIIIQPRNLTITGMISNSPVDRSNIFLGGAAEDNQLVAKAFEQLDALFNSRTLVTIYTRYKTYPKMAITNINIPRSPDMGDAIVFTIQATQVNMVSKQMAQLPKGLGMNVNGKSNSTDSDTKRRAGGTVNLGKSTTEVTGKEEEKYNTVLYGIYK